MTAPLLEVREVRKSYGATPALRGVSFVVNEGEMFGLLGPNGAGKTTLLSILAGLSPASAGEVRLAGQVVHPGNRAVRRLIGVVPQDLAVYGSLTAAENLRFFGELYGLGGGLLDGRVQEILDAVGLADRAGERVQTYSGGMKRRLNLGAALVHGPRLLLLDEPTVGVDTQSRNHIFEEVRRRNRAGLTVIYTSHYMEEVQALCTRIGIIDQGLLQACDTLPRLLQLLRGRIGFRVARLSEEFRQRVRELPGCTLHEQGGDVSGALTDQECTDVQQGPGLVKRPPVKGGGLMELECSDVQGSLVRLVALLSETKVDLLHLQTEEPDLERVFLHLTGRNLRD
jgi:ABC-2 type transport system ATP-binding protein